MTPAVAGTGKCRGHVELSQDVISGNRWPAVSGALLAETACRCATLAMLSRSASPVIRDISVRFRKAIPVADPRSHPRIADGATTLSWSAVLEQTPAATTVDVEMTRLVASESEPVVTVIARAGFDAAAGTAVGAANGAANGAVVGAAPGAAADAAELERRISDYLTLLPRRLALPAYELGWTDREVRGGCRELPGSLVGVAEQALGDAGKIVRGDGVPEDRDESMLIADMTYRWIEPLHDGLASYLARAGSRRTDEKGRTWVQTTAALEVDGRLVGEAAGSVVFRSFPRRT